MTLRSTTTLALLGLVFGTQSHALQAQQVVEVTGRDRHLDTAFEEVFRVGTLDGEPWEMFGFVRTAAFDADGNLYLFDGSGGPTGRWTDVRVLVYSSSGEFMHEFGTTGQGPGEFNAPVALAVLPDGTSVVSDIGHRAYQLFDASGAFVRAVRVGMAELAILYANPIHPDPRGSGGVCPADPRRPRHGARPCELETGPATGSGERRLENRHRGEGVVASSSRNRRRRGGGRCLPGPAGHLRGARHGPDDGFRAGGAGRRSPGWPRRVLGLVGLRAQGDRRR